MINVYDKGGYVMKINEIKQKPILERKKRVAAYARVSTGKDTMLHSLSNQVSYYSNYIQSNEGWLFCGVYVDEAISGTKEERANFQKMLEDCREGKIDVIVTKSISRFARNLVTLLSSVRELSRLGINVYFEEQNMNSMSPDGELMLSILASYAQEESKSVSDNMKWRIRSNFQQGLAWNTKVLGYKLKNGKFYVVPEEALLVKRIYALYLKGNGFIEICKILNEEGVTTSRGRRWSPSSVRIILVNYLYTGNLLLQRTYKDNYLTKRKTINNGELNKYHVEESHEAIIDSETFDAVQKEIDRRAVSAKAKKKRELSPFSGLLTCAICGKHYRRKGSPYGFYWICGTFSLYGKENCASKQIPENILIEKTKEVLKLKELDGVILKETLVSIEVRPENVLLYKLKDGTEKEVFWSLVSRKHSWTPEMKERARQLAIKEAKDRKEQSHANN